MTDRGVYSPGNGHGALDPTLERHRLLSGSLVPMGRLALASNSVTTFAINPLTGVLSAVGGATATGIGPGGIAILRALD